MRPPVSAFNVAKIIINENDVFIIMNDIIDKGAIFCQVERISAGIHATDVITDGYHKWHGAMPIFIRRENKSTIVINVVIL